MKKKLLSMLLITTMTVTAFTGCGSKQKDNAQATQAPTATEAPEATTAPEPAFSTEELETAGSVDALTYTNSLIGFSVTVPESWSVKGSDDTYDYLVNVTGMAKDVETLKSQLTSQGVNYLFYGLDSEVTDRGGSDNVLAQSMSANLFGDMDIETVISSLSALIKQQYTSMGATCTISDPVKSAVGDQDVYQVTATATIAKDSQGNDVNMVVRQEYLIFVRNGVLVYMAISTSEEDSATIAKEFIDTLSFQ
jgi:hypothetical protein